MQWCGLKLKWVVLLNLLIGRHHWCSGVDWNSPVLKLIDNAESHHWCSGVDWNIEFASIFIEETSSPLMQWCGLKFVLFIVMIPQSFVTTDAVVWIEMLKQSFPRWFLPVTTDAVVWIEIRVSGTKKGVVGSPLMQWCGLKFLAPGLWRGGFLSPLMQWCGLKSSGSGAESLGPSSPLMQWCGLKFLEHMVIGEQQRHHWCSGGDWNLFPREYGRPSLVTTDAVVWIEIFTRKS